MLKWLTSPFAKYKAAGSWGVTLGDELITTRDGEGDLRQMPIADLRRVVVATDDSGPMGDDVVYFLLGTSDEPVTWFPMGAEGETEFIDWITRLPGFRADELIGAMGSTHVARFIVYDRP